MYTEACNRNCNRKWKSQTESKYMWLVTIKYYGTVPFKLEISEISWSAKRNGKYSSFLKPKFSLKIIALNRCWACFKIRENNQKAALMKESVTYKEEWVIEVLNFQNGKCNEVAIYNFSKELTELGTDIHEYI